MDKVTFSGTAKHILVLNSVTELDVRIDIYSAWKEWLLIGDNSKYEQALSVIGGDPITDVINAGATFFLENGWKIKPYSWNHTLIIIGNIYTRDGSSVITPQDGSYRVTVEMQKSNLIDIVNTTGGGGYTPAQIADAVLNSDVGDTTLANAVNFSFNVDSGRWKLENNQLKLYGINGSLIKTFDLFDSHGSPSLTGVFERIPV